MLIQDWQPRSEIIALFRLILEDQFKSDVKGKFLRIEKQKLEIEQLKKRKEKLVEKLLDEVISNEEYKNHEQKLSALLNEKEIQLEDINDVNQDLLEYLQFGVFFIEHFRQLYHQSTTAIKQKLLSSILDEKLVFDGEKYRTPKFKKGVQSIYQNIRREKNKKRRRSFESLLFCTRGGT